MKNRKSVSFPKQNHRPVHISEDVLIDILLKLPAKSLNRFKTVNKAWKSLITCPGFITKHLHLQKSSPEKHMHVMLTDKCSVSLFFDTGNEFVEHSKLPSRFVHGSCDGLLCFGSGVVKIGNPATGQCLDLPSPLITKDVHGSPHIAFGFHPATNDYKVVRLIRTIYEVIRPGAWDTKQAIKTEAEIYNFRTKSWRLLGSVKKYPFKVMTNALSHPNPTVIDGTVYWFAGIDSHTGPCPSEILAFDMGTEIFRHIELPINAIRPNGHGKCWFTFAVGESLGFVFYSHFFLDIWVSDFSKSAPEEVWTRRCAIENCTINFKKFLWGFRPLLFRSNGDLLFVGGNKVLSCNLETQKWYELGEYEYYRCGVLGSYIESLVPVTGS